MKHFSDAADAYATVPLLNCLLQEAAEPIDGSGGSSGGSSRGVRVHRLRGSGRLLRVSGGRRPVRPELRAAAGWQSLGHAELVKLTAEELRRSTGIANDELPAEMADSRDVVAVLLAAREGARPPEDPYLRSEQSLVMGHPCHPAPKARGGGPARSWLPYAPEAYASFPLEFLAVRAEDTVEEGGERAAAAVDALAELLDGPAAPPGYRLLPAHPWQLELIEAATAVRAAFADGRLLRLGRTRLPVWPTASVRTVHVPGRDGAGDLFAKFSLDVRITNDVRRLWRHDLLKLRETDAAVEAAFGARTAGADAADATAGWLSDRGYRTAGFAFEELAVLVRDGLDGRLLPGTTPLLAASLVEGFTGGPLERLADPVAWWVAYLRAVVPPALELFAREGIVLEAHLQNTVIALDSAGLPVQALFRDAEGVKRVPGVSRAAGWQRLVYTLLVNHVREIASAIGERHPGVAGSLWPAVRRELLRCGAAYGLPEALALPDAPELPGKANLLLRWTGADGASARYLPLPNPMRPSGM
ncbi:iron transporter [Streptomyces venezuelae]|uniref:Iron transporter n=1 Tax=Streptomyces venezuelae TaxID=54571 RepID=A0A5P2CVB6_STRVZ|nr:IucA/IucC family protein [Streptomyces venezuelae]QES46795.1 iron transporter [Streptomyces venezuelae]